MPLLKRFYTRTLLHLNTVTNRHILHTYTSTHRCLYTQVPLYIALKHTSTFTHRHFYTQTPLPTNTSTQEQLLRTNSFRNQHYCTHTLLHTQTHFTDKHLYTQTTFTHKLLYTRMPLHTGAFTHRLRRFYTQTLLHTDTRLLHTDAFTHKRS